MSEYYMDCNDCGWSGIVDWDKMEKCPECGSIIEPANEIPSTQIHED